MMIEGLKPQQLILGWMESMALYSGHVFSSILVLKNVFRIFNFHFLYHDPFSWADGNHSTYSLTLTIDKCV